MCFINSYKFKHCVGFVRVHLPLCLSFNSCLGSENYAEAFKLLVNFLDYPHNQQSMNGWRLFRVLTSKWYNIKGSTSVFFVYFVYFLCRNSYKESPVWIKRSRWWNKLYKDRL